MPFLILALCAAAMAALAWIPVLSFISIIGFALGVAVWVLARKMYLTGEKDGRLKAAVLVSAIATFANLAAIMLSFVLGSMLYGGFVVF